MNTLSPLKMTSPGAYQDPTRRPSHQQSHLPGAGREHGRPQGFAGPVDE
jgi:hypothetical protein